MSNTSVSVLFGFCSSVFSWFPLLRFLLSPIVPSHRSTRKDIQLVEEGRTTAAAAALQKELKKKRRKKETGTYIRLSLEAGGNEEHASLERRGTSAIVKQKKTQRLFSLFFFLLSAMLSWPF